MKLRESESLGVFDDHNHGIRYVHTYLDNHGGHKKLYFAALKIAHYIVLFLGLHLTVQKSEPVTPECGIL